MPADHNRPDPSPGPLGSCPDCGYAVSPGRCPECGRSNSAWVLASRNRALSAPPAARRRFRRSALLLALAAIAGGLVAVAPAIRRSTTPLWPTSWLVAQLDTIGANVEDSVLVELWRRLGRGALTSDEQQRFLRFATADSAGKCIAMRVEKRPRGVALSSDLLWSGIESRLPARFRVRMPIFALYVDDEQITDMGDRSRDGMLAGMFSELSNVDDNPHEIRLVAEFEVLDDRAAVVWSTRCTESLRVIRRETDRLADR